MYESERPLYEATGNGHENSNINNLTSFERVERIYVMTAWQWLAEKTGFSIDTVRKLAAASSNYVLFSTADKVLTAMDMVTSVDIEVLKNPIWSQEKYQAWREQQGCF